MSAEKENILQQKSFSFALEILNLCNDLSKIDSAPGFVQNLLQSGTEMGVFIEETKGRQSAKNFYSSIESAYKSAQKMNYWLELLAESKLVDSKKSEELLSENDALIRIMGKTLSTLRKKEKKKTAA
jgi:four helix bundle protein